MKYRVLNGDDEILEHANCVMNATIHELVRSKLLDKAVGEKFLDDNAVVMIDHEAPRWLRWLKARGGGEVGKMSYKVVNVA